MTALCKWPILSFLLGWLQLLALIIFKDFCNIITCFKCFTTAVPNVNGRIKFVAMLCCMASFVLLHVRSPVWFQHCATATAAQFSSYCTCNYLVSICGHFPSLIDCILFVSLALFMLCFLVLQLVCWECVFYFLK